MFAVCDKLDSFNMRQKGLYKFVVKMLDFYISIAKTLQGELR